MIVSSMVCVCVCVCVCVKRGFLIRFEVINSVSLCVMQEAREKEKNEKDQKKGQRQGGEHSRGRD